MIHLGTTFDSLYYRWEPVATFELTVELLSSVNIVRLLGLSFLKLLVKDTLFGRLLILVNSLEFHLQSRFHDVLIHFS